MEPSRGQPLLRSKFLFILVLRLYVNSNAACATSCPEVGCDFRNRWCGWSNGSETKDGHLVWERDGQSASLDMRYKGIGTYGLLTSPLVEPLPGSVCRLDFRYHLGGRGCGLSLVKQNASGQEVLWMATDVPLWQFGFSSNHTNWFPCDNGGAYRLFFKGERTGSEFTCGPPSTRINVRDVTCTMNLTAGSVTSQSARTTGTSRPSTSTGRTSNHSAQGFGTDVTPNHAPGTADCAPPGQGLTVPVAVLTAAGVLLVVVLVVVALVCRRRHRRSQRAGRTVCGPGAGCNRTFIKSCFNQSTNDDGFNDPLIADGATDGGQRRYGSQDLASGSDLAQPGSGTGVQRSEVVARGRSSAQATSPSDKPGEATDAQQGRDTLSPTTEAATTVDQSSPAADERPPRSNTPHTVSRSLDTASGHYEVVTLGDADSGTASPLDPTPISSEANASTAGRGPLLPPDHDDSSSSSLSQQLGEADETKKSGGRWHRHGDGHDSAASLTAADGYSDLNRCSDPSRDLRRSHAYENYSHV